MSFLDLLFEPAVLPFTVPVLLSLVFWLLTAFGLFDLRLLDPDLVADLDADADVDADVDADLDADAGDASHAHGVLHLLGVGAIPLTLVLTLFLFCFGFAGIGLHALLGGGLGALGWSGFAKDLVFGPVALLAGTAGSAGGARLLGPLFRDYGAAPAARALVGRIGVVKSSTVSATFGEATVRTDGGPADVAVRTDAPLDGDAVLHYGDQVVVLDYDAGTNTYLVERLDDAGAGDVLPDRHPPRRLAT